MLWRPTTIPRIFIFNRIQKPQYYTCVNFRIFEKLCKLRDIYKNIFVRVLNRKNLHEQNSQNKGKQKKKIIEKPLRKNANEK